MKNYNMLREKFVINTIEGFVKEYDGIKRGNTTGVRIVVKGPKDALLNGLIDRLAAFDLGVYSNNGLALKDGSRISVFDNDNFIDYSRGLTSDVVILYDANLAEIKHSLILMAYESLNKLITV